MKKYRKIINVLGLNGKVLGHRYVLKNGKGQGSKIRSNVLSRKTNVLSRKTIKLLLNLCYVILAARRSGNLFNCK